jgi:sRNA-binding regulator protein Hfq
VDPHKRRRGPPHAGRRAPPPPATGEETTFFEVRRASGRLVSVHLRDGTEIVGRITYHDRDLVKLERNEGPHLLVRKTDIRYIADRR